MNFENRRHKNGEAMDEASDRVSTLAQIANIRAKELKDER